MRNITKIAIAAATLCLLSACGQSRDTKEDLAKLKNLSPKAAYSMRDALAPGNVNATFLECVKNATAPAEIRKMAYSGKYKSQCENIINNVQSALDKKGIHVSNKTLINEDVAMRLYSAANSYAENHPGSREMPLS